MSSENNSNYKNPHFCAMCGNKLTPLAKFCSNCGSPVPLVASNDLSETTSSPISTPPQNKSKPPKPRINLKLIKTLIIIFSIILVLTLLLAVLFATRVICVDHKWSSATCVEPEQCIYCGKHKDENLGNHNTVLGDWNTDYCTAKITRENICTICGNIDIDTKNIESFVNDNYFTIYPYDFAKRFEESSNRLKDIDYNTAVEYSYGMVTYNEDNYLYYRIRDVNADYSDIGLISFTSPNGKTISGIDEFSSNIFSSITILIEDASDVSAVVYAALLTIDPGLDYDEAAEVGQVVVDEVYDLRLVDDDYVDSITKNSISYALCKDRNYHYLLISVESN